MEIIRDGQDRTLLSKNFLSQTDVHCSAGSDRTGTTTPERQVLHRYDPLTTILCSIVEKLGRRHASHRRRKREEMNVLSHLNTRSSCTKLSTSKKFPTSPPPKDPRRKYRKESSYLSLVSWSTKIHGCVTNVLISRQSPGDSTP